MKKHGNVTFLILSLLLCETASFAATIETELERSRIAVGEEALLQIKVSGAHSAEVSHIPTVDGISIEYRGTSRSFQWINGQMWSGIVLSFAIVPTRAGTFTIPPFEVRVGNSVHRSRAVQLVVIQQAKRPKADGSSRHVVYRKTDVSKSHAYVGEPVIVRYFLLHSGIRFDQMPVLRELPQTKWCVQHHIEEKVDETIEKYLNEEMVKTHLATFLLIPTMKGKQIIRGGEVVVSYLSEEGFFPFPRQARVNLEEANIEVNPLPDKDKPKDFSGNVGNFTMETLIEKKELKVYDETKIKVIVRGNGNFITLSPPQLEEPKGAKIVKGTQDAQINVKENSVEGIKEFIFTVIPERSGTIEIGPIRFNFFDPTTATYRELTSEKIALRVEEEGSRGGIDFDEQESTRFEINYLWILFIVLGIAAIVGGMVYWERKKYRSYIKEKKNNQKNNEHKENDIARIIDQLQREIILASSANPDEFLKTAEKVITKLSNLSLPKKEMTEKFSLDINKLKNRVYTIRYGGYSIGPDEVKDISGEIRALLRALKDNA